MGSRLHSEAGAWAGGGWLMATLVPDLTCYQHVSIGTIKQQYHLTISKLTSSLPRCARRCTATSRIRSRMGSPATMLTCGEERRHVIGAGEGLRLRAGSGGGWAVRK